MNIKNEIIEHYKKFFDILDEDDHLNIDWAVNFFESHLSTKDKEIERLNKLYVSAVNGRKDFRSLYRESKDIENLEKEKELILQQARYWAFEAKTQRNTVNQVGSLIGGIPDWGAIVKGVREKIEKSESESSLSLSSGKYICHQRKVLKEMEEALTMCKESFLIIKNEISSVDIINHHEIDSRVKMINNRLDTYNKLKEL
jgi:hypothetical protein